MRCLACAWDNPGEARFCGNCGAPVAADVQQPPSQQVPSPAISPAAVSTQYMGFWVRFGAWLLDTFLLLFILLFVGALVQSGVVSTSYAMIRLLDLAVYSLFALYFWLFTGLKGQTPGKMIVGIKVVDRRGQMPGLGRAALRELLGKLASTIVLFLGFFWAGWDRQKQAWHDKLAGTYVIKAR